jgi:hypothetical protein
MKAVIAIGFCASLTGCLLTEPPTPRTIDINTLTERQAEQLENNIQSGVSSHITLTGRYDLSRLTR